jgi:cytochrome c biogenesis protein CcdA
MMVAGLAFATGCMTCFGSALVIGMVVYVGMAQSALYGGAILFLFSLGMGIPLVIAGVMMAKVLPILQSPVFPPDSSSRIASWPAPVA